MQKLSARRGGQINKIYVLLLVSPDVAPSMSANGVILYSPNAQLFKSESWKDCWYHRKIKNVILISKRSITFATY